MAEPKDEKKSCIYPCPDECAETALFVDDSSSLTSIKEKGVEGYDLVYVADVRSKQIFMFGKPAGFCTQISVDPSQPVHNRAHEKAAEGEVVSYEWSVCEGKNTCFFQSTLIPLRDSEGKVGSVLGLVKNITSWAYNYSHTHFLKEVGGRTFPQLLLMAREEERRKISSALHDEIGSAAVILTSLLMMCEGGKIDWACHANDAASTIHDTVALADAVQELLSHMTQYKNIKHTFTAQTDDGTAVSDEVKIVLYRVAQESLNNVIKHSGATRVDVSIKRGVKDVTLKISDNGKGFKTSSQQSINHIGLLSMRDSVAYLGGNLTIKSEPGKGTVIEAKCPKVAYGVNRI